MMAIIKKSENKLQCYINSFIYLIFILGTLNSCECDPNRGKGDIGAKTPKPSNADNPKLEPITDNMIHAAEAAWKSNLASLLKHIQFMEKHSTNTERLYSISDYGITGLTEAVEMNNFNIVDALLKRGAKLAETDKSVFTPLHAAALKGYNEVLIKLIKNGADLEAQARGYMGGTPLHLAAGAGNKETVLLLFKEGANINAIDSYKATPLHRAAEGGKVETLLALLENGANIDAIGQFGYTPLHYAAEAGKVETLLALLENGANIDARTYLGKTPLHLTAGVGIGKEEAMYELLKNKAIVNTKDLLDGNTPLHLAAMSRNKEKILALLEKGAKIEERNNQGNTPLHLAAEEVYNSIENLSTLLEKGANIDERNNQGNTPLHLAAKKKNIKVVEKLLEEGAQKNIANNKGKIPSDVAKSNKIRRLLIQP